VKQRLPNGHAAAEIVSSIVLIILILFPSGSVEEPAKMDTAPQTVGSSSETHDSTLDEPQTITIGLPDLPEGVKKLEMVLIEPGPFTMGSPRKELGRAEHEWPAHQVTMTRPFYMGKYEVTQAQWEAVMGSGSHRSKFRGNPNLPVEKISWLACQKFIKRLNKLGQGTFRLPTEAEWEYSCRADTQTRFSFGDGLEIAAEHMWWNGNNHPDGTKEVGLKLPNAWGLYDMHGNVWEWCWDRWEPPCEREDRVESQEVSSDWWLLSFFTNRVCRGGSFRSSPKDCRSAHRFREQSFDFHYSLGFRVVREYP
jgi:formylglycine-generating enzyme required for sulfatase activity